MPAKNRRKTARKRAALRKKQEKRRAKLQWEKDFCLVEPGSDSKVSRVSKLSFPNPFGTMFRKEVFIKEGLYEAEDTRWEPETLGAHLSQKYRIGHIPIPFYRYQQEASPKTLENRIEPKGASER